MVRVRFGGCWGLEWVVGSSGSTGSRVGLWVVGVDGVVWVFVSTGSSWVYLESSMVVRLGLNVGGGSNWWFD
uniref:Transmembrane protein n=1 Tax=Cannabis sativa TaxID=3483 RepID=A0A803Q7R3_CANSA